MGQAPQLSSSKHRNAAIQFDQFSSFILYKKDATFMIAVFAISIVILAGVLSYTYFRVSKRDASSDTIIAFNNYRRSHIALVMDVDSPLASPPYKSFYARSSLIYSESESFTSIKISPSCPTVFGHGMDAEGIVRVVLTPPTPAKRKRRESLIDDYESGENLPAYN